MIKLSELELMIDAAKALEPLFAVDDCYIPNFSITVATNEGWIVGDLTWKDGGIVADFDRNGDLAC